jgi:AcrR family transcriptional regulator
MTPQSSAVSSTAPAMRRPGSRRPLDREFILTAALDIIDTHGAEGLTMRALATHLESGTTTLYRHFHNRAALIAAVIDRVLGRIDSDAPDGTWQQVCKFLAQQLFDTLAAHPNLAPLIVEQPPKGPGRLAGREQFLAVLLRDGFTPDTAGRLYGTLSHYVLGFAVQLRAHAVVASTLDISGADPIRFPATAKTVASGAQPMTIAEEFTYGLDLILGIDRLDDHREGNP